MYFNIDKKTHDMSFCNFTENVTNTQEQPDR